jgi:hypothetical protein
VSDLAQLRGIKFSAGGVVNTEVNHALADTSGRVLVVLNVHTDRIAAPARADEEPVQDLGIEDPLPLVDPFGIGGW